MRAILIVVFLASVASGQVVLVPDPSQFTEEDIDTIALVDMDEDGVKELYVQCSGNSGVGLSYAIDPNGSISHPVVVPGTTNMNFHGAGDLDQDGHTDLYFSGVVGYGDGFGGISQFEQAGLSGGAVADYNNDGILDLAGSSTISLGLGNRLFGPANSSGASTARLAADFNADGNVDLAARAGSAGVRIYFGDGTGQFVEGPFTPTPVFFGGTTLDLNGDPYPDLLVLSGGHVSYWLTQPDGTLLLSPDTPPNGPVPLGYFGDLNGDGSRDFVGLDSAGTLYLQVSDPAGGFFPIQEIPGLFPLADLQIEDLNGDGYDEVIWFGETELKVLRNATGLSSADCDGDGISDALQIANGTRTDCDLDGIPDRCQIESGAADCNLNGVPDSCDIDSGFSLDSDLDGVPDECAIDCNGNGLSDAAELEARLIFDCDEDGLADECAIALGSAVDCNENGRPDSCDIADLASDDFSGNGVPDECEGLQQVLHVPLNFPSIQAAINASSAGDHIIVAPGVYTENIVASGRSFRLRSSDGPDATILQGTDDILLRLSGIVSDHVWIEGFTIRDGTSLGIFSSSYGGAVNSTGITLTLWGNKIMNNSAYKGGALFQSNGQIQIERNTIFGNSSETEGAAGFFSTTSVTMRENVVENNHSSSQGGAISCFSTPDSEISRNRFSENSGELGGAISVNGTGFLLVADNEFFSNRARIGGAVRGRAPATIRGNLFVGNIATDDGGALYLRNHGTTEGNRFLRNSARRSGGGAYLRESGPARSNEFGWNIGNTGGGLYSLGVPSVEANRIHDNHAVGTGFDAYGGGGAFFAPLFGQPALLTSNWIYDNTCGLNGGGVSTLGLTQNFHNTFVGNRAQVGSAIHSGEDPAALVTGTIVWDIGMQGSPFEPGFVGTVSWSIVEGGAVGAGNSSSDPLFVDLVGRDLHLQGSSPAIGSAPDYPGPPFAIDIDGTPRQVCGGSDRGADEVVEQDPCEVIDSDFDGYFDMCAPDCDNSGVSDLCEILSGVLTDCNGDDVPDPCDTSSCEAFVRGDANLDSVVDVADVILGLGYLFAGGVIGCELAIDGNDDGFVDISDPISILVYLFSPALPPPAPFPSCGIDMTPNPDLDCSVPPACP